ncbi:LPS export ABC transporter periplasmic protein LptC [Marinomonas sp. A79]|uniref:LPS export ABC transporter periplasmic protein LptC n=1 Tax=Marinomonas vulgaris TaxID=2823372 RepID=A0ABS5HAC2_9GAMM|nr:LPS export ABC transporter periplasmic protein LptC [Marinomonas vulgaris]MBR7887969.1 LPS export ABC transporter periplasmic protein LptC [Marinomonas vulgaris]
MAKNRTLLSRIGLIIMGLGVASSAFWFGATTKESLVQDNSLSSSPDYFITKVAVKKFDDTGALVETLHAEQTLHYIARSTTLLENPSVERRNVSGKWTAKADKGVIEDGSDDILLTDNATATKQYLDAEDIQLMADNVHYLDNDQTLTSYGNATLLSTQGKTSAETITTFVHSEEVIMTGSVRGLYESIR